MKVLIVGGVAGGATAAARLRRLDEKAEIIMIERSGFVSYANCGLPYYVGGVIEDKTQLTLQTPERFYSRFRIDVRTKQEVIKISPSEKTVTIRRLEDGTIYEEAYDKLLLSPGAKPIWPALKGIDHPKIFTLRTVEDTLRIRSFIEEKAPKRAVVIGGGFIGLEMAENLKKAGMEVALIEREKKVMPPLDGDMACSLQSCLRRNGIQLYLGKGVTAFEDSSEGVRVLLEDEESVDASMVVLAIGVLPETKIAQEAGLTLGTKGAIVVNEGMETSEKDIYAVGDAVEIIQSITGLRSVVPLAGPANKQARIAADNISGRESQYAGTTGTSVMKLFDMSVAATGLNEKTATEAGIPWEKVVIPAPSHAAYYPGGSNLTLKVLFHRETGRILGAQITGFDGVDKRIDVIATAIYQGATAKELTKLDLAYAPPFSSAKDPVNIAGYVIENVRNGLVQQFHWEDVKTVQKDDNAVMLDVTMPEEFQQGHIPGAINIPLDQLRERLGELSREKKIYVNCGTGLRSYIACRILKQHGFECYNLAGGYRFYQSVAAETAVFDREGYHPCGVPIEKNKKA